MKWCKIIRFRLVEANLALLVALFFREICRVLWTVIIPSYGIKVYRFILAELQMKFNHFLRYLDNFLDKIDVS